MKRPFRRRKTEEQPTGGDEALAESQKAREEASKQASEARPILESLRMHQQENHIYELVLQSIQRGA